MFISHPRAPANGQPTIALAAVANIASGYQATNQAPNASSVMYWENELGRIAVMEIKVPVLNTSRHSMILPVLAPNCLHTDLQQGLYSECKNICLNKHVMKTTCYRLVCTILSFISARYIQESQFNEYTFFITIIEYMYTACPG